MGSHPNILRMLKQRRSAQALGVPLFTRDADEERVLKIYQQVFDHLTQETKLSYDGVGLDNDDVELLAKVLPYYLSIQTLTLRNNKIGLQGAVALGSLIPKL